MDHRIQQVFQSIMEGNEPATAALCRELIAEGIPASRIVRQGMIPCMDQLGGMLARQEKFIPQIMMSTRAMQSGLKILAPYLGSRTIHQLHETVVIGTVRGDIHTIGKTLVSIMLQSAGFKVVDLGTNVGPEEFVEAVLKHDARIVALSAMLTTTMPSMKATVRALQKTDTAGKLHILIGGAPVNSRFAGELGVEYASDAVETMNQALCICGRTPKRME